MTLNANDVRDEYTASASQTVFNYTFKIYESTDLNVYVTPAGQECSDSDLTSAYSVSGVGAESGGTITLTTPTSAGDLVTIVSGIPTSRTTDYQNNGDFRPDTVNDDFDRAYSLVKQALDQTGRSLQFPLCQQGVSSLSLPSPVAQNYLRWKADLTGLENQTIGNSGLTLGNSYIDYDAVRGITSSTLNDGDYLWVEGFPDPWQVKTGTVTDNGWYIVFSDDSNRYCESTSKTIYPELFGAVGDGDEATPTDDGAAIRAMVSQAGGREAVFTGGKHYYMSSTSAGAYVTLSTRRTTLKLERGARITMEDAAVKGIDVTADNCEIYNGDIRGTDNTTPSIGLIYAGTGSQGLRVDGTLLNNASKAVELNDTYIVKLRNMRYANNDQHLVVSGGSTADISSKGATYGSSSSITSSNAFVEIAAPGVSLDDYWETMDQTRDSLELKSGAQRVICNGKVFDSGGVTVGANCILRLDVQLQLSYTNSSHVVSIASGGRCDATGSYFNGNTPAGVKCIDALGGFHMGGGEILNWETGVDVNAGTSIGSGVFISGCTTAVDIGTSASGKIDPAYGSNTTNAVRTTGVTIDLPRFLKASTTYDPASLNDGGGVTTTITATGALVGDQVDVSFSQDLQGILLTAWTTTDTVNVRFQNETGGTIDLASGTLRAVISGRN